MRNPSVFEIIEKIIADFGDDKLKELIEGKLGTFHWECADDSVDYFHSHIVKGVVIILAMPYNIMDGLLVTIETEEYEYTVDGKFEK